MNSINGADHNGLWSLGDMLELQANSFMWAVTELRQLVVFIQAIPDKTKSIDLKERVGVFEKHIDVLIDALSKVGARSALASANRLKNKLKTLDVMLTYNDVGNSLKDIESRFADHLNDIKLLVLNEQEATFFEPADTLLSTVSTPIEGFSRAFPSASFEIEEAAKCIALNRYTASVFHCMRALECGIKALAKLLGIPDPTKPGEKNWGIILSAIRDEIDKKWPKSKRLANSPGANFEALYATLDAVKNPWRNATMHVEATYVPHEALHILSCVSMFMLTLIKYCDEDGVPSSESPAKSNVSAE